MRDRNSLGSKNAYGDYALVDVCRSEARSASHHWQRYYPQNPESTSLMTTLHVIDKYMLRDEPRAAEIRLQSKAALPRDLRSGMQVGVFTQNAPDAVARVRYHLREVPDAPVSITLPKSAATLGVDRELMADEVLHRFIDISRPSKPLLEWIAQQDVAAEDPAFIPHQMLGHAIRIGAINVIQEQYSVPELLEHFSGLVPFSVLEALQPKLANRKFTLSDVDHESGQIALMIAEVEHEAPKLPLLGWERDDTGPYRGVASRMMNDVQPGDEVPLYLDMRRRKICYPDSPAEIPLVMLGTGVGMASHMAFLREAERDGGYAGDVWLLEGGRYADSALVPDEIAQMQASGLVNQYDYVASRNQKTGARGMYVQDVLQEQGDKLYAMLERGAIVCVNGYTPMLEGVREAIKAVAAAHGVKQPDAYLAKIEEEGRLQHSDSVPTRFHDKFERRWLKEHEGQTNATLDGDRVVEQEIVPEMVVALAA